VGSHSLYLSKEDLKIIEEKVDSFWKEIKKKTVQRLKEVIDRYSTLLEPVHKVTSFFIIEICGNMRMNTRCCANYVLFVNDLIPVNNFCFQIRKL